MKIQVQIVQGPAADCTFTIEKNSRCMVGRGDEADYSINNDELISRQHFQIEFDGKAIKLMDLGSTNGTFVDGNALVKNCPVYLNNGQSFIAGRVSKFVVSVVGADRERPAVAPPLQMPFSPSPDESRTPATNQNPSTNFGSSIDIVIGGPPESSSSSSIEQAGGNFSQSIVIGIDGIPGSSGSTEIFDVTEQSGLLLPNPAPTSGIELGTGGAQSRSQASPSHSPPGSVDVDESAGPSEIDRGRDFHGSISAPGDLDGVAYQFAPLEEGERPSPEPPQTGSETPTPDLRNPVPTEAAEPREVNPAASPFASIQQGTTGSPAAASPHASVPTQPMVNPTGQIPPPPVSSENISSPENMSPMQSHPAAGLDSIANTGSIGLPNQIPTDQPMTPVEVKSSEETAVPPGKVGFDLHQQANGLFFHSGMDVADLDQVLETLQKSFETIYCADLTRAGFENDSVDSAVDQQSTTSADTEVENNFVSQEAELDSACVQSPFENLEEEPTKESPNAEPNNEETTSSHRIGTPLFYWLPSEARWDYPVLLNAEEVSFDIKDVWQADALVCFFGSSAKQISEHCLKLIKTDIRTGKKGDSMFGFCWPTILECTLESARAKAVNRIFEGGVAAILVEDPQEEMAWHIVSKNNLTELLTAVGFVRKNQ